MSVAWTMTVYCWTFWRGKDKGSVWVRETGNAGFLSGVHPWHRLPGTSWSCGTCCSLAVGGCGRSPTVFVSRQPSVGAEGQSRVQRDLHCLQSAVAERRVCKMQGQAKGCRCQSKAELE